ncbi:MAG: MraY family glycosyltransferase [Bacilli bacterium]|nr:MraY family glycosyltransferase [Bacilli bacterium]
MTVGKIILILLVTFFASFAITPLIRKIAFHIKCVDKPNKRRVNIVSMPTLGGLAIFISFLIGIMFFCDKTIEMIPILIGGSIIIILGIIDGINPIRARYKLVGQILAALVVVLYGNTIIQNITAFGYVINFGIFSYPITVFFIVAMINAINLIDGLDGLAAGISSIYFLTIGIIAVILNKIGGIDIQLSFIMLGATLGFLVHNFYPAKIYLGDTGSMFLGFIISIIALLGFKNVTLTSLIVPILILGIPIFDTVCAIIRRIIKRKPIGEADKQHLHHQFLNMNYSHRTTVLIIYMINILFALASIIYILKNRNLGIFIYVVILVIVVWIITQTSIIIEKNKKGGKKK